MSEHDVMSLMACVTASPFELLQYLQQSKPGNNNRVIYTHKINMWHYSFDIYNISLGTSGLSKVNMGLDTL